jgi:hypothetical protein
MHIVDWIQRPAAQQHHSRARAARQTLAEFALTTRNQVTRYHHQPSSIRRTEQPCDKTFCRFGQLLRALGNRARTGGQPTLRNREEFSPVPTPVLLPRRVSVKVA